MYKKSFKNICTFPWKDKKKIILVLEHKLWIKAYMVIIIFSFVANGSWKYNIKEFKINEKVEHKFKISANQFHPKSPA